MAGPVTTCRLMCTVNLVLTNKVSVQEVGKDMDSTLWKKLQYKIHERAW